MHTLPSELLTLQAAISEKRQHGPWIFTPAHTLNNELRYTVEHIDDPDLYNLDLTISGSGYLEGAPVVLVTWANLVEPPPRDPEHLLINADLKAIVTYLTGMYYS